MPAQSNSFTLVELVVVIVIVGIMSAMGGLIITNHMEGYGDMRRRAELVYTAESALRRMQRDIRAAVPNSIRTWSNDNYQGISFLHTVAGGRYRSQAPENATGFNKDRILTFDEQDEEFAMLGKLLTNASGRIPSEVHNGTVVIYNTGQTPLDANEPRYENTSPIHDIDNATGPRPLFHIQSQQFPYSSPLQHFQVMDAQVRYVWDRSQKTLKRYQQDADDRTAPESAPPYTGGDGGVLIADYVTKANFTYEPGTHTRAGLMTLELTLKDQRERISLLHQVHMLNFP